MGDAGTGAQRSLGIARLAGALLAFAAHAARADVFVVDTAADTAGGSCPANPAALPVSGTCSLRDAIAAANQSSEDDLILFAPSVFGQAANKVITLASPLPDLDGDVEINATSPLLAMRAQGIVVRAGAGVSQLFAASAGTSQLDDVGLEEAGVAIDSDARLVFAQTVDATFAEAITGDGSLEKRGTARLVLTGTNTFAGELLLEEGTLQGDTLSIPGDVSDDGLLVFDQEASDPPDFLGAIRGTGRLQKIGTGMLFLRTANSYGGGTTVSAGTLAGFAGNATTDGSLQGDIQNDAILVFEQAVGADGTFSGSIRGSGRVEKTGLGALFLTGTNSYTGGTTLSAGRLEGAAGAIVGDVAIASGAQLRFDEPGTGTHSGRISGGGGLPAGTFSVEKSGAGTLTLAGANSYTGGTLVSGGTLRGNTQSLQGDIQLAASTALVFDQSFSGAYTGLLSGAGALEKRGGGTVVLTRDLGTGVPAFAGPTTISGGRLEVGRPGDGAILPGDVSILAGALGGVGSVGGHATANAGGAISPGNSTIDMLQVGNATFLGGSFLEVEVSPTNPLPADRLIVVDTATIQSGAQVRVIPGAGDYTTPVVAVILDAQGAKSGLFDPIPDGTFAFLDASLEQSGNQVQLTVVRNDKLLPDFAETPNQRAVGTALDEAQQAGDDPDLESVFDELNTLQTAEIPGALEAMTGEQLTEFATARLAVGQRFLAAVDERIVRSAGPEREPLFASRSAGGAAPAGSPWLLAPFAPGALGGGAAGAFAAALAMQELPLDVGSLPEPPGFGAWLDGYGIFGDVSGTSGADDFDTTIWGVSAGLDFRPAERWIAGLAGGYARSRLDFDSLDGRPEVDTAQGAAYLGYASPRMEAGAAFRYAWNHMTADRDIRFAAPSTLSRSAESDFDGSDLGGRVGAAVQLVDVGGVAVKPFSSLTYTHLQQDGFDESGAGSLDLSADEEEIDSLLFRLGARLHTVVQFDDATWLRPELRAAWVHEFGDRERKLEARIGGVPGATMTVRGAELPRDAAELGIGWTVGASDRLRFFTGYDLAVNSDLLQHSVGLGLELLW